MNIAQAPGVTFIHDTDIPDVPHDSLSLSVPQTEKLILCWTFLKQIWVRLLQGFVQFFYFYSKGN